MNNEESANASTNFDADAVAKEKNELPKKDGNDNNENTSTPTPTPEPTNRNEEVVTDSDLWKHRLEENRLARRKDSKFYALEPGETVDLEIVEILGPVGKDFDGDKKIDTIRYEYRIQDLNDLNAGIKTWGLSKSWSEALDYQLSQGNRAVRVSRKGSGMQTKYYFYAINVQRSK